VAAWHLASVDGGGSRAHDVAEHRPEPVEEPTRAVPAHAATVVATRWGRAAGPGVAVGDNDAVARRSRPPQEADDAFEERIVDIDVADEMRTSFLEYAYSVIYSRAIPDARDGLKPVQRRILFTMADMGLRPDRGHVKCARIVGEVMGRLHPHGDTAIYDTLVRLAQDWNLRVPLVDGHGNFGNLDDGPAAYRYTEARLAEPALLLTASIDEDTVDMVPNYDGREQQPDVLPSAFPNLLVNGSSGIAVGMATNMPPHNLGEVVAAARHLIDHPDATLDDLMRIVPGPDFPTGGKVVGLDGIREAYESGRGTLRLRATARIESVTARRKAIVITELPYTVGPEQVREKVADLVRSKKLQGVADVEDYTDRTNGLRLVVELKSGFVPEAVLDQLFRLTALESTFAINNVALVGGQPRTLGLQELLEVYLAHRFDVVRRRSAFRRRKREDRLHLVDGLMVAILDIDEVIQLIRASDDAAAAKERLIAVFDLSDVQAQYILDTPLRRLTKLDRLELESEGERLRREIADLTEILEDPARLRRVVSDELAEVARAHATPRRTVLLEGGAIAAAKAGKAAAPLEVRDDPCWVLLSSTGLLARTTTADPLTADGTRSSHDVLAAVAATTARGAVGAVTSRGRMLRLEVLDLPALPPTAAGPTLSGGAPVQEYLDLEPGEQLVGLASLLPGQPPLLLGTRGGVVKRLVPDIPANRDAWDVIALRTGDTVVAAAAAPDGHDVVFCTSDAQLLRFPVAAVRPQGRDAAGMAGIRLADGAVVIACCVVDPTRPAVVVTVAGSSAALPGTEPGSVKVCDYAEFPPKGRATGGVRCHRFLRGEDILRLAWAGAAPARAAAATGVPITLPATDGRRDGSGVPAAGLLAGLGPSPS
jgi:DNA gyrase subunit A